MWWYAFCPFCLWSNHFKFFSFYSFTTLYWSEYSERAEPKISQTQNVLCHCSRLTKRECHTLILSNLHSNTHSPNATKIFLIIRKSVFWKKINKEKEKEEEKTTTTIITIIIQQKKKKKTWTLATFADVDTIFFIHPFGIELQSNSYKNRFQPSSIAQNKCK